MARTIIVFTNGDDMVHVESDLVSDEVNSKISPTEPLYHQGDDALYLLLDKNMGNRTASVERELFAAVSRPGDLHYVHHTAPDLDARRSFMDLVKANSPDLRVGLGFHGEHNSDNAVKMAYPYQRIAAFLLGGAVEEQDFEDLWHFLNGDPILEDLITLLRAHALAKANGQEKSNLAAVETMAEFVRLSVEGKEKVRTAIYGATTYAAVRDGLVAAVKAQDPIRR